MTASRFIGRALFAATALTAVTVPASAQQIDRIVAFGDSYADDGNFFELAGIPPATTTIYASGRFSGGTNYVDTLGQVLNVPIQNFAIGGAKSDITNVNNPVNWGFTYEVDQFLNVGTQSAFFPTITAPFNETDLVTVSIGGNDARAYQLGGGTLAGAPAAASTAVTAATGNLNRLVAAGAPTISFLAGDTGRLPEIAGNPTGAAIRTAYSNAFNTGIQGTLAGYAANGVIVHYLDLNAVLNNIAASPSAYGITNGLSCPALPSTTCVINSAGYLFYVDQLHLTSDGFKVVAAYVAEQLEAPLTLQAPADLGMDIGRNFGRTMTARMDLGAPRDGDTSEGLKFFVAGDAFSRSLNEGDGNLAFGVDGVGGTLGAEYGFGTALLGLAGNYTRGNANFDGDDAKVRTTSAQIGIYGGAGFGGGFVQWYFGYGWDDHEIDRAGVVIDQEADSDGEHWLGGAKAGYLFPVGAIRLGPVLGVDYAKVRVDGYTESGDAALTLNVGRHSYRSLRGSVGLEARGDFEGGGVQFRPYAALAAEKDMISDDRSINFAQTSAPGIVNSFQFDDVSARAYGRATGGFAAQIFDNVSLGGSISMTFGKKQGNESSGNLGLKFGF
jgi:outer membrane lipase/esterase